MIKTLEELQSELRDESILPAASVELKNGTWSVQQRVEQWKASGPRVFDQHLDALHSLAVAVLTERDPQFELPPERRFEAAIHGKTPSHSPALRKGLAETLALLGTMPEALTSCSQGKAEDTAALAVRDILKNADWVLWASLNNLLPTLAEAAPAEFLKGVSNALAESPSPFAQVFRQESSGIAGQNYMTGLLWALETLAWSSDLLQNSAVLLAELAMMDPGGNWSNRPIDSLTTIFLPWLIQTTAPTDVRNATVNTILREQPDVGWKLLLNLLPQAHSASSGTHRPKWRKYIPEGWTPDVKTDEYWNRVHFYAALATTEAIKDARKVPSIIPVIPQLSRQSSTTLLNHLKSPEFASAPEPIRIAAWEALCELKEEHKRFPRAAWTMKPELLSEVEAVACTLAPTRPAHLHQRLFSENDFTLLEGEGTAEQQFDTLKKRRDTAIQEILRTAGLSSVIEFSTTVRQPYAVGLALGHVAASSCDPDVLPAHLDREEPALRAFIHGFVVGRFTTGGWRWIEALPLSRWAPGQVALLFSFLPFQAETWRRAEVALRVDAAEYWKRVFPMPLGKQPDLGEAAERLLAVKRPRAALCCLNRLAQEKEKVAPDLVVRALKEGVASEEPATVFGHHDTLDMIKWLQDNNATKQDALMEIEWSYLALLDHAYGGIPKTLDARLSSDPKFFCDVLALVFKSEKERSQKRELTAEEQNAAKNAFKLLYGWETVPGTRSDGKLDAGSFGTWLHGVLQRSEETGHLGIAMSQIGEVLPYSPADPDGLWIHRSVAEALNGRDADAMRSGFTCGLFNRRGVYSDTGGKEELALAKDFREKADALERAGYHRVAAAVRGVAEAYNRDAAQAARGED